MAKEKYFIVHTGRNSTAVISRHSRRLSRLQRDPTPSRDSSDPPRHVEVDVIEVDVEDTSTEGEQKMLCR